MLFWKDLEMSKTKIIKTSAEEMETMIQIYLMPATGAYETVKSKPSILDDPSAHVIEYMSR